MAGEIIERVTIRRDVDFVAKFATDPATILPIIGAFGRFQPIDVDEAGCGEWDVFINLGSTQVGGRVVVRRPDDRHLAWEATRGTRHTMLVSVEEDLVGATVEFKLQTYLAGGFTGRLGQFFAHGIVGRHLVAGLQQLRHHLEHEV